MSSSSSPELAPRPYYVILAGVPATLEVIGVDALDINAKLDAMSRTRMRHAFALPNDVILAIDLHQVTHWTVTPERPKDVVIVPVVLS